MGCPYKKHDHYIDFQFPLFYVRKGAVCPPPPFFNRWPSSIFWAYRLPSHSQLFDVRLHCIIHVSKFFSRKILFYADLVSALLYPRKKWRPSWEGHVGSINNCVEPDDLFSAIPCGVCLPLTKKRVFHLPPPIYQTTRRGQSFINV